MSRGPLGLVLSGGDALGAIRAAGRRAACDWLELSGLEDRLDAETGNGARVLP